MLNIHMIGLGGSVKGANVEVHDLQFVLGDTLHACLDEVKDRWYGDSLHIDSDTIVTMIDGYDVVLEGTCNQNLYLIVYGGYDPARIDEIHAYDMILADSKAEAKHQAKTQYHRFDHIDHVDNVVDVFQNLGRRFGLIPNENATFQANQTTHMYLKIKP